MQRKTQKKIIRSKYSHITGVEQKLPHYVHDPVPCTLLECRNILFMSVRYTCASIFIYSFTYTFQSYTYRYTAHVCIVILPNFPSHPKKIPLNHVPYMLRRAECDTLPARFSAIQEYSPPSSTITWVILTWLITSPCTVTYWPIINLHGYSGRNKRRIIYLAWNIHFMYTYYI